jgi:preprotein translocase subunit YajC
MPSLIFVAVMIAAFYMLLIRPQQRRMRQQTQLLQSVQVGDEIITIGGIFARVTRSLDDRFEVEVADGSRFEILRSAVARRLTQDDAADELLDSDGDDEGIE